MGARFSILAALPAWAACTTQDHAEIPLAGSSCESVKDLVSASQDVDLLFVIDRSPNMADQVATEAAKLTDAMSFIQMQLAQQYEYADLHVGVISSDLADMGRLQATPHGDCSAPTDPFLIYEYAAPSATATNFTGTLADTLACIGSLGDTGDAAVEPLAALQAALDPSNLENAGFLRPNALLAIVFIGNQDDESPGDVTTYAGSSQLDRRVDVGLVTPCATSAPRLTAFIEALRWGRGGLASLCDSTWDDALMFFEGFGDFVDPCLPNVDATDIDPATPGLQIDCSVTEITYSATVSETDTQLPRCEMSGSGEALLDSPHPCWWVIADSTDCPNTDTGIALHVDRDVAPPSESVVQAICSCNL